MGRVRLLLQDNAQDTQRYISIKKSMLQNQ